MNAFNHCDLMKEKYMDPFLGFMTGGEKCVVCAEAVTKVLVWQIEPLDEKVWFQTSLVKSPYSKKGKVAILYYLLFMLITWLLHKET